MRDYTNKTIYLGIDVHKKTYSVTAICERQVVKKDTLQAKPEVLVKYCKKYFVGAQIESAYEAGYFGFHLHRYLENVGIKNLVINAGGMEIAAGDRVKTDRRDSLKLATHLFEKRLKGIHIPSCERENYRIVTRLRDAFVKQKARIACQLKALLSQFGLIQPEDKRKISLKWIKALEVATLPHGLKYAIDHYVALWQQMDLKIKEIEKEIAVQALKDRDIEMVYRSVPGIGPTSARTLANELEDTLRFNNERQLFSYVGLTPSEYSSGEHIRQGRITRQSKAVLRKILVEVAWKTIRKDPSLKQIFDRISIRAGKKRAIVGIARRLVGRIRACFKTGELYRIQNEDPKTQITNTTLERRFA